MKTSNLPSYISQLSKAVTTKNAPELSNLLLAKGHSHVFSLRDDLLRVFCLAIIIDPFFNLFRKIKDLEVTLGKIASNKLAQVWIDFVSLHLRVLYSLATEDFVKASNDQNSLCQQFHLFFSNESNWCLAVLYVLNKDLRTLSIEADDYQVSKGLKRSALEEAARTINKAFTYCITDRFSSIEESRKWGTYYICTLLMKTYIRLKQTNLCTNMMKVISGSDLPALDLYPIAHRVLFRYYSGILHFQNEDFTKVPHASSDLIFVLEHIPVSNALLYRKLYTNNRILVLTHIIPIRLLQGILPSPHLLAKYPSLATTFGAFVTAIRTGDVRLFDESLLTHQRALIRNGTYLIIERCRSLCVRVLFQKVWFVLGRKSMIEMSMFRSALSMAGVVVDGDEVECVLAGMIDRGFLKGYLSHEKQFVVLSQKDPFPAFGSLQP
ncbi:COP9 signalosome (CSN) subunit [Nowakowskiella sp. JEL0078]|nr:COP9 signalosome (CSN) subunit [Nowakowskiella sp. JEL0078]